VSILAIDAGPAGVTATVVGTDGRIVAGAHEPLHRDVPQPGWGEQAAEDIWRATLRAGREVLGTSDGSAGLTAIGITTRPDTVVLWDRETLGSPRPAIGWSDRRSTDVRDRLRSQGHAGRVAGLTGRRLDAGLPATSLAWLAEHEPRTWALVEAGRYAVGTVDSYLVARMTRGTWHVTDVSHASSTLLLDLETGDWSDELCALFGVPRDALPELVPSWGEVSASDARSFLGLSLPIAGIAANRPAALFGQACFDAGDATCTYGATTSVIAGTGASVVRNDTGLLTTAAWRSPAGTTTYALEATVPTDEALRTTVDAVGAAVAGLPPVTALRLGGAPASDDSLCQLQADRLGRAVERPRVLQTASLGAAFLAGLGSGVWGSPDDLREVWALDRRFEPGG
jgi:glycerol kinase